jgi:nucleolin
MSREDEVDEWDKPEEEENWDPDFDEFDIPRSRGKKAGKKESEEEEDDFKFDDDLKEFDLFNDSDYDDESEDDF